MAGQTIRYHYGNHPQQFGDLRVPDGGSAHPVIIIIHGGFWRSRYTLQLMDDMAEDLCHRGYVTWNIEYRRVGQSGGGWPGTVRDVADAIDYLAVIAREIPIELHRAAVIGHSAGGHLALWQAVRGRFAEQHPELGFNAPKVLPQAIISLAGVTDLPHMHAAGPADQPVAAFLHGLPEERPDVYQLASPVKWVPLGVPQLLVHGTEDTNVPYEQSMRMLTRGQAAGDAVRLLRLPGADHFAVIQPDSTVWPEIVQGITALIPV